MRQLEKVCLFGDPQQCEPLHRFGTTSNYSLFLFSASLWSRSSPHNPERIPNQTICESRVFPRYTMSVSIFTCAIPTEPVKDRMPIELGKFLSKEVYNGRLQSKHEITDASCIRFIDVSRGFEETSGSSFEVRPFISYSSLPYSSDYRTRMK